MVETATAAPSLPYHEPGIVTILVLSSFLLLLNVVNSILDRLVYCGLLGQVLVGIAWGTPGAKWLPIEAEEFIVQLGYLGLILLVYEVGGLSTSFKSLKANLLLSSAVALTGIAFPIGFSYTLQGILDATPVQAFAAGAALCSTSLGTTFTVLASSGLSSSRLGVVLTSAAMMDDVVGLVIVQVISNLGSGNVDTITIVRPVLVSIAFAVVVPLASRFVVKPLTLSLNGYRKMHPDVRLTRVLQLRQTALTLHTALLLVLITGASYAGTSNLFAAYITGASISWWDSELPHPIGSIGIAGDGSTTKEARATDPGITLQQPHEAHPANEDTSGSAVYEHYYQQAVGKILQPFFFASIGFSIPITRMFQGSIVWRGIVYTILMTFGKLVCGLWLVRFSLAPTNAIRVLRGKIKLPSIPHLWGRNNTVEAASTGLSQDGTQSEPKDSQQEPAQQPRPSNLHTSPARKPFSLHPPLILAFAMTARGEIGFLISAVAESNGVFSPSLSSSSNNPQSTESDIFLVVTWAIVLCTIFGPLGVGLTVRRVKMLEQRKNREQEGAGRDVFGVWGVG
ncbi:Sodium/hydrogen exchanger [Lentithecium fluviatile CBS 122367]|uniref:Sodium/hydrogen exchanger n=1 Tax=Lentithecium fluviatile CBS 122367 TaxID=1168545 RepID=A0A6G1INM3_9PLEO|nr:Sodium/hydrogen exchanger [Lentithecium fluviatile CBS 122367]